MSKKEALEAFYGLPNEVRFCKSCVISNQRPSSTVEFKHEKEEKKKTIGFAADGVWTPAIIIRKKRTESTGKNAKNSWSPRTGFGATMVAMT